jgi:carbon-monoxide dehydrogenase large subunit
MTGSWVGQALPRKEDRRFLTGQGTYVADVALPGMLHGYVVRSPHAHADVLAIDAAAARAAPGVAGVFLARDLEADGIGTLPCGWSVSFRDGRPMIEPPHPVLAGDRVRHVGDLVAFVVAETAEQARDAAERIVVDYGPLPAATDLAASVEPGAPQVWPDAPGNLCYDWEAGDRTAVNGAFAAAAHIVHLDLVQNRISASPMETRGAVGVFDPATERYTLYTSSQNPHIIRVLLANSTLRVSEEKIRVVSPDVGGGFGMKIYHYAEEVLVLWAAFRLHRPVRWIAERSEAFLSDTYARDHVTTAEMALDPDGVITAIKVDTVANMGAYLSTFATAIPSFFYAYPLPGPYLTRAVHCRVRAAFTNTVPVDAYRGAGRPEATYVLERLIDEAAARLGLDRAQIRRRNLIPREAFPYQTPLLWEYDDAALHAVLDHALATAAYDTFEERRAASAADGLLRGIGMAVYMEACGMGPSKMLAEQGCRAGQFEVGQVRVHPTGAVTVLTGSHTHGQGHETVFAQIVADRLGVDIDRIDVVHGDTDRIAYGLGSYGSRSLSVGGSALNVALDRIVEKARRIAAHILEASAEDVVFEHGVFSVAGTDMGIDFQTVVGAAYNPFDFPHGELDPGLDETAFYDPAAFTFPYGCHVCEVIVDPETGQLVIERFVAVDDFGNQVNPLVVAGQLHGGIVQGLGQGTLERCVYDPASGQLLTGSFMDYAMPRAADVPSITAESIVLPCRTNPLGVKGCGEAGAIAAPSAVMSAILDALGPVGVTQLDMPATPQAIWRAIRDAGSAAP